ncbi:DUF72 domain-containing protein [Paraglaciecola sp. 25GB23A]|uniref:DUF72 domain-containing protein n=1 Tax=Paraglaciecola sp. 25GB23A TaxID=3156068 RepID=UPI0032AFF764
MKHCYIGCPIWTHPSWFGHIYPAKSRQINPLESYSRYFNSIEGNSSFYHLPEKATLHKWADSVPEHFRFSLKLPRTISHESKLDNCAGLLEQALEHFNVLGEKLGLVMLQLPASFSPAQLPSLQHFIEHFPSHFSLAVELRHLEFFAKGEAEIAVNRLFKMHHIDRVIMDTRGLFACAAEQYPAHESALIREVQAKKPRVPTHVIATAQRPIVRFVGQTDIAQTKPYYRPWLHKIKQWLDEGKHPTLFFHMPDNKDAPWLAQSFVEDFNQLYPQNALPNLSLVSHQKEQKDLF